MSWVQQVRRTEHSLIAVLSQDADLTVEALSNLPSDARGRLQTLLALAEETAAQAASGTMVVVDTGLGTAQYHLLESGEESSGKTTSRTQTLVQLSLQQPGQTSLTL
eukprot:s6534_g4.t1